MSSALLNKLTESTYVNRENYHQVQNDELAIESEFGQMLMDRVKETKPKSILEIGTGNAYSTSWLGLGMLANGFGKLVTYDWEERPARHNRIAELKEMGCDVEFKKEDFTTVEVTENYDFVFHDSQHRFELITPDLEKVIPHLNANGEIWVHDVKDTLHRLMKEFFEERKFTYTNYPESCGICQAVRS